MRSTTSPARGAVTAVDEVLEEGGLADARLAAHHHAAGRPVPRPLEEVGQVRALALTAD